MCRTSLAVWYYCRTLTNEDTKLNLSYVTLKFISLQTSSITIGLCACVSDALPKCVLYILSSPGWVIMYLSVLRLFPSRTQPGCIWVDHVFTYRSSDWHRVKRGSPSPARTSFLQVNPEIGFFYGLVWHWTRSLFWHHRETVTYYRYGK